MASDLQFGLLVDFHQANAAIAGNGQRGMIAVTGNINPQFVRRLDDRCPCGDFYWVSING